ncbi:MAG: hypothetical protein OXF02_06795 [Simkaniaceae bacterium]|nr:hypothetical protein [Simkaniaceae bacterium]
MVGPIAPPTVVVSQQTKSTTSVVNQPVVAPAVVSHIAPIIAVNNVAQEKLTNRKKESIYSGALIAEGVIGAGCTAGAGMGVAVKLANMGTSVAIGTGAGVGTAFLSALCALGIIGATAGHYYATGRKRVSETA